MWPFDSAKKDVNALIGGSDAWLRHATVVAWQPDPNYKPESYFIVNATTEAEFRSWAASLNLLVGPAPAIPPNVFVLPAGVSVEGWSPATEGALDARGTRGRVTIWSRWRAGRASTVVTPEYD